MAIAFRSSKIAYSNSALLGFGLDLQSKTDRGQMSVRSLTHWLNVPINLGQVAFSFSVASGYPNGMVSWAYLSDEVSEEISSGSDRLLDVSEWNEGDNLWIMDVVALDVNVREFLTAVRARHFPTHDRMRAIRRRGDGSIKRIMDISLPSLLKKDIAA